MPVLFFLLKALGAVLGVALGVTVAAALLISAGLLLVLLLQVVGVVPKVPFGYNLRNLVVRWRTTLLTALAFTLVVGLMTVMLAFVNGMYRLTQGSGQPGNVMVLSDGATDELSSNLGYGDITAIALEPGVEKDGEGKPLVSWEVYVVVNQPIPNATGSRRRRFVQVRGVEDPVRSGLVHNLALHPGGEWFSQGGVRTVPGEKGRQETAIEAVVGEGLARELGPDQGKPSLGPGDVFELGPLRWVVVGVMQSAGSTFDSEVWARHKYVGETFGKQSYTTVVLRAAGADAARELARHLADNYRKPAVSAQTETEYFEKLSTTNQQFLYAIVFVVVVMAVGGVFGVMNTMFATISQRTKDIGVLRILGYARWQVLACFFLESLLLALAGGLLGCALGSLANGWSASSIISGGQGGGKSVMLKLVVDARILGAGLGFAFVMGCVGGVFPALSAMRLRPLEALR